MAIERRTHDEQRRNGGPARELHAAGRQKLCRHLTPIWEGAQSGHDTEGQKRAVRSEAPVFGREFNCISTCRQVKRGHHEGVQLTQSAASLAVVGLAESYLVPPIRIVCHPRRSGVASIHANLPPVLRLLLLYVLRRRVFWRREARQLRIAI
jgi:hypothetical protein